MCSISLDWDNEEWVMRLFPPPVTDHTLSVRKKIRGYEGEEYYYGKDFFPRCLYAEEAGDPKYVRRGYLQSALLVKVIASSIL